MRSSLVMLVVAVVAACGDPEPTATPDARPDAACSVPDGTYQIALTAMTGTCPADLLGEVESALSDANQLHTIQRGACGPVMGTMFATGTSRTCDLSIPFTGTGTAAGIENGQATLTATCDDGTSCTHAYAVTFTLLGS